MLSIYEKQLDFCNFIHNCKISLWPHWSVMKRVGQKCVLLCKGILVSKSAIEIQRSCWRRHRGVSGGSKRDFTNARYRRGLPTFHFHHNQSNFFLRLTKRSKVYPNYVHMLCPFQNTTKVCVLKQEISWKDWRISWVDQLRSAAKHLVARTCGGSTKGRIQLDYFRHLPGSPDLNQL